MNIYDINVELLGGKNQEFPSEFSGAFVHVFVPSNDLEISIVKMKEVLQLDGYELIEICSVHKIEVLNLDSDHVYFDKIEKFKDSIKYNFSFYGVFHCYR